MPKSKPPNPRDPEFPQEQPAKPPQRIFSLELALDGRVADTILRMADENLEPEVRNRLTDVLKIGGAAKGVLERIAAGGFILDGDEIDRLVEATGIDRPECGEDLVDICSRATGIEEGKFVIPVAIDPAYVEYLKQPAEIQGISLNQLLQDAIDYIMDNDVLGYMVTSGTPHVMRMGDADYQALKEVLGEDFDTGTKLAQLYKKLIGGPMAEEEPAAAEAIQ
jgi:hypothetical protein